MSSAHLAMDFSNAGITEPAGDAFRAHVTWYDKGVLQAARGCGTYCRSNLSELRKAQNGTSIAMYPSVAFGFHTQGYVIKGRRLLSDAPFGRFSEALAHRRPRIRREIFLSFFS